MNKLMILGNVGSAEFKTTEKGTSILKFSLATNKKWKNDSGEVTEEVQWHRCTLFGKRAESLQQYVVKGKKLLVEGEVRYGSYEKEGVKHYTTDVIVNELEFAGSATGSRDAETPASSEPVGDSEIPF
jgi:single-strand DNA-binding protein